MKKNYYFRLPSKPSKRCKKRGITNRTNHLAIVFLTEANAWGKVKAVTDELKEKGYKFTTLYRTMKEVRIDFSKSLDKKKKTEVSEILRKHSCYENALFY